MKWAFALCVCWLLLLYPFWKIYLEIHYIDWLGIVITGVVLVAMVSWFRSPRSVCQRISLGTVFVLFALRGGLVAWTQRELAQQSTDIVSPWIGVAAMALSNVYGAYRFFLGKPTREYFAVQSKNEEDD